MKKALVAVILFSLLLTSLTVLTLPNAKADLSEAKILSYSWYSAPSTTTQAQYVNDLVVVGEVQNIGSNPLDKVIVSGGAYNATGGILGSAEGQALVSYLLPGQKAPFYLDFTPEYSATPTVGDETWTPFVTNVTLNLAFVEDSNLTQFPNLVFPSGSLSGSNSSGIYTLTGTVQNSGAQATGNVWVVSTFYNDSGTVVGLNYTDFISSSLAPGNVATFTATPIDNDAIRSSITNYTALIQSEPLVVQATPTPTPYQQPTSTPSTSTQPTQSPAPIFSNVSSLIIIGVIIAVIIIAIIGGLLLFRKRRKTSEFDLPPPPPPPPPE